MSLEYPLVSFQEGSSDAKSKLLDLVKSHLARTEGQDRSEEEAQKEKESEDEETKFRQTQEQQQLSFQVRKLTYFIAF